MVNYNVMTVESGESVSLGDIGEVPTHRNLNAGRSTIDQLMASQCSTTGQRPLRWACLEEKGSALSAWSWDLDTPLFFWPSPPHHSVIGCQTERVSHAKTFSGMLDRLQQIILQKTGRVRKTEYPAELIAQVSMTVRYHWSPQFKHSLMLASC